MLPANVKPYEKLYETSREWPNNRPGPARRGIVWWRHQMETFSALLALCAGNSPMTGEFPAQRPVTRSFDVFVFFIYAWTNGWVNDMRHHRAHYHVTVMVFYGIRLTWRAILSPWQLVFPYIATASVDKITGSIYCTRVTRYCPGVLSGGVYIKCSPRSASSLYIRVPSLVIGVSSKTRMSS